ncbi:PREDICTED: uncharacterized protein LOC106801502 [Ceratotherium simum simum]|uniref:Uncharacterized protein LOC106801502 n=1 Tax=Ceratotherium simum simum TaxID=73337 RepID=A0ABM1CP49_CERSS|nr:PREDICTED: uncharacterized protein LOC106801502 [Ceratotherium simum simum]
MELIFLSPAAVVKKGLNGMAMLALSTISDRLKVLQGLGSCKVPNLAPPPPSCLPDPLPGAPSPQSPSAERGSLRPRVTSGRFWPTLLEIPGCKYHGCHQSGTVMEIESRVARKALRAWGFEEACQRTKVETAGRQGTANDPRNCAASALPVNLPPSFSGGSAPLGRVGLASSPGLFCMPGFCSRHSSQSWSWAGSAVAGLGERGGPEARTEKGGASWWQPGGRGSGAPR